MKKLEKEVVCRIPREKAFHRFVNEFREWWPKAYTWSGDQLWQITINDRSGGLCTELGPNDFRCDWGTVTSCVPGKELVLKWQIGPNREPVPDPEKASEVRVEFAKYEEGTRLRLTHTDFDRHGDGGEAYFEMMNSEKGWEYILECYQKYCGQNK